MITVVDERLRQEAREFALKFGCEQCVVFDAEGRCCSHRYPNAEHMGIDLERADRVVFCKEFEAV